jgi:hypothetical protein
MKLNRSATATALVALVSALTSQFSAGTATADELHNVTYRARVDGLARGALITYKITDTQVNSSDPTMLPGRTFEANAVLDDPALAGMRVSIQWPYSANLHCEILVDDNIVAQADQFIGPRLTPANDDPDYGALTCGAPLINASGTGTADASGTGTADATNTGTGTGTGTGTADTTSTGSGSADTTGTSDPAAPTPGAAVNPPTPVPAS